MTEETEVTFEDSKSCDISDTRVNSDTSVNSDIRDAKKITKSVNNKNNT